MKRNPRTLNDLQIYIVLMLFNLWGFWKINTALFITNSYKQIPVEALYKNALRGECYLFKSTIIIAI